jgi:hypothetical protein
LNSEMKRKIWKKIVIRYGQYGSKENWIVKKFIFRYQDLVEIYSVSAETIINDTFSYSENVQR